MSEARIQNWHRAIAENVPDEVAALEAEVIALDTRRAECVELIHDLEEMLMIARRRVPVPTVLQLVDPQLRQA